MFNVPGVIGVNGKDGTIPKYSTYGDFIVAMTGKHKEQDEY